MNPPNVSRAARYSGRVALNRVSTVKACRECGRVPINKHGAVGVRLHKVGGKKSAGFAGLSTCGRIWLCPVCNSKVMASRALEIGVTLAWASANGYSVIWGSLTASHRLGVGLGWLINVQRSSWRRLVSLKPWWSDSLAHGGNRVGYIRAAEITVGANGWHPHFHPLIIVKGSYTDAVNTSRWIVREWVAGIKLAGGSAVARDAQQLVVLRPAEAGQALADYVTKARYTPEKLALEAVWSQSKVGARRGRVGATSAHWGLLTAAGAGEAVEGLAWWELEAATAGHRMIAWSRELRALVGLGVEASDEKIAAATVGDLEDTVCWITPAGWVTVANLPDCASQILDVLEQGGWSALRAFLDLNGVVWVTSAELDIVQYSQAST